MNTEIENKQIIVNFLSENLSDLLDMLIKQDLALITLNEAMLRLILLQSNPLLDNIEIAGIDKLIIKYGELLNLLSEIDSLSEPTSKDAKTGL